MDPVSAISTFATLVGLATDLVGATVAIAGHFTTRELEERYLLAIREAVRNEAICRQSRSQTSLDIDMTALEQAWRGAHIDLKGLSVFARDLDMALVPVAVPVLLQQGVILGVDTPSAFGRSQAEALLKAANRAYERTLLSEAPELAQHIALSHLTADVAKIRQSQVALEGANALPNQLTIRQALLEHDVLHRIWRRTNTTLSRPEYAPPAEPLARPEQGDLIARLTRRKPSTRLVLSAEAGVGKSSLLSTVARALQTTESLVLFWDLRDVRSAEHEGHLAHWLEINAAFQEALTTAAEHTPGGLIILADQFDSVITTQVPRLIRDVARETQGQVTWVFATRASSPQERDTLTSLLAEGWEHLELKRLSFEAAHSALQSLGIENPVSDLVEACRTPVHLAAVRALPSAERQAPPSDRSQNPLSRLWRARFRHVADVAPLDTQAELLAILTEWAWRAQAAPSGEVQATASEARARSLALSDGLVLEVPGTERIRFAHELIPAIVVANELIGRTDGLTLLFSRLSGYAAHYILLQMDALMPGAVRLVFLAQVLQNPHALLQTQISLFERHWPSGGVPTEHSETDLIVRALKERWPIHASLLGANTGRKPLLTAEWSKVLQAEGLLALAPEGGSGGWACQRFLEYHAASCPEVVEQHIQQLRGLGHIHDAAFRMLTQLPPQRAAANMDVFCARYRDHELSESLVETSHILLRHLVQGSQWDAALTLLETMLEPGAEPPVDSPPDLGGYKRPVARCDTLLSDPQTHAAVRILIWQEPSRCLDLAESRLSQSILKSSPRQGHWDAFWSRDTIDDFLTSQAMDLYASELLDLVRDSLYRLCETQPDQARVVLQRFLASDRILKRLALHTIARYGLALRDLARDLVSLESNWLDRGSRGEFAEVVRSAFEDPGTRAVVMNQIEACFLPAWQSHRIDEAPGTPAYIQAQDKERALWTRDWFGLLRENLAAPEAQRLTSLESQYGPAHDLLPQKWDRKAQFVSDEDPVSAETLASLSPTELVDLVRGHPTPSSFEIVLREDQLAAPVARLLFTHGDAYLSVVCDLFTIRPAIAAAYFQIVAYENNLTTLPPWSNLVDFAELAIQQYPYIESSHSAHLRQTRLNIAHLLEKGFLHGVFPMPHSLWAKALRILATLSQDLPTNDDPFEIIPSANDPITKPMFTAINSTRWAAMEALVCGADVMVDRDPDRRPWVTSVLERALHRWLPLDRPIHLLDIYVLSNLVIRIQHIYASVAELIWLLGVKSAADETLAAGWRGFLFHHDGSAAIKAAPERARRLISLDAERSVLQNFEPRNFAIGLIGDYLTSHRAFAGSLVEFSLLQGSPHLKAAVAQSLLIWCEHFAQEGKLDLGTWAAVYELVRLRRRQLLVHPAGAKPLPEWEMGIWVSLLKHRPKQIGIDALEDLLDIAIELVKLPRWRNREAWTTVLELLAEEVAAQPAKVSGLYQKAVEARMTPQHWVGMYPDAREYEFLKTAIQHPEARAAIIHAIQAYNRNGITDYDPIARSIL